MLGTQGSYRAGQLVVGSETSELGIRVDVLHQALGRVLSRLLYAFPRIRKVWSLCPGSEQPAAAMKTHLAKFIGLIEEERAIVSNLPYGHCRLKGSIGLNSPSCIAT